jgi:hypothetical protein
MTSPAPLRSSPCSPADPLAAITWQRPLARRRNHVGFQGDATHDNDIALFRGDNTETSAERVDRFVEFCFGMRLDVESGGNDGEFLG